MITLLFCSADYLDCFILHFDVRKVGFNSSKLQLLKAISCMDTDNGKEAFIQTRMIPDGVLGLNPMSNYVTNFLIISIQLITLYQYSIKSKNF